MNLYNGPHLNLRYDKRHDRFINSWTSSPNGVESLKNEMLQFKIALEKINPSQVLWLQEKFSFQIEDATKLWLEETIMIPRYEAGFIGQNEDGFHHIAFVVGADVMAHMEVMGVFDKESTTVFKPKHFATQDEAEKWLNKGASAITKSKHSKTKISYKGIDKDGNSVIEFRKPAAELGDTIRSFKTLLRENDFMKQNIEKFSSLSPREKETLKFIIGGATNEEIAKKMFVSPNTIRTHRNRIWKKLNVQNLRDCYDYKCFFKPN